MLRPYCPSTATTESPDCTELSYRRFRGHDWKRAFNERTGAPCNWLQYSMALVCLSVLAITCWTTVSGPCETACKNTLTISPLAQQPRCVYSGPNMQLSYH